MLLSLAHMLLVIQQASLGFFYMVTKFPKEKEGKLQSTIQAYVSIMFANVPLAKAIERVHTLSKGMDRGKGIFCGPFHNLQHSMLVIHQVTDTSAIATHSGYPTHLAVGNPLGTCRNVLRSRTKCSFGVVAVVIFLTIHCPLFL